MIIGLPSEAKADEKRVSLLSVGELICLSMLGTACAWSRVQRMGPGYR